MEPRLQAVVDSRALVTPTLLLPLSILPALSRSQSTTDVPLTFSQFTPLPASISSSDASIPSYPSPSSLATSFTSSFSANSSESLPSPSASYVPPGLFQPSHSGNGEDPTERTREGVFNYYFLFLILAGALVALALWWMQRRRKRRKEQLRRSGQNALARDLDGWVNTRRWMHGGWRHGQTAAFVRREEGLNEDGEAPPPYEPGTRSSREQNSTPEMVQSISSVLTIPRRPISSTTVERSTPPEYHENFSSSVSADDRPDTGTTPTFHSSTTRPDTAHLRPASSTQDLVLHSTVGSNRASLRD